MENTRAGIAIILFASLIQVAEMLFPFFEDGSLETTFVPSFWAILIRSIAIILIMTAIWQRFGGNTTYTDKLRKIGLAIIIIQVISVVSIFVTIYLELGLLSGGGLIILVFTIIALVWSMQLEPQTVTQTRLKGLFIVMTTFSLAYNLVVPLLVESLTADTAIQRFFFALDELIENFIVMVIALRIEDGSSEA